MTGAARRPHARKLIVVALHVIAGILTFACASPLDLLHHYPVGGRPLAIGGAAFAVFWDGKTRLLLEEGAIGAAMSLLLLVTALGCPRVFP